MMACGHRSSSFLMLLSYCPRLVAQRRCRLKPHRVSSDRRSSSGRTEPMDKEGPHRRDCRDGKTRKGCGLKSLDNRRFR